MTLWDHFNVIFCKKNYEMFAFFNRQNHIEKLLLNSEWGFPFLSRAQSSFKIDPDLCYQWLLNCYYSELSLFQQIEMTYMTKFTRQVLFAWLLALSHSQNSSYACQCGVPHGDNKRDSNENTMRIYKGEETERFEHPWWVKNIIINCFIQNWFV